MLRFVEDHTPLRFELLPEPDPLAELPGGVTVGRMLSPRPLAMRTLGPWRARLRPTQLPDIFTYRELITGSLLARPVRNVARLLPRLLRRSVLGERALGSALVGGLLKGCLDAGCAFALNARALSLVQDADGTVRGLRVDGGAATTELAAAAGVILASGGFEWDEALFAEHFPGPAGLKGSPRSNTGDGQRMAAEAGAALERMDQANVFPCIPGTYEGLPHGVPMTFQAAPHAIAVNPQGERFANEYDFNFCEGLDHRDQAGVPANLPAWVIADARFLRAAPLLRRRLSKQPRWVRRAATVEDLAVMIGVPARRLAETVARYNRFCLEERDPDFRRGESLWDRHRSGRGDRARNSALGRIEQAPFVALPLGRSVLGTKGGARTDPLGRVLRADGSVIAGLFCAGNAMANPIGTRAPGSGTTIGPCMTWGFIGAKAAVEAIGLRVEARIDGARSEAPARRRAPAGTMPGGG